MRAAAFTLVVLLSAAAAFAQEGARPPPPSAPPGLSNTPAPLPAAPPAPAAAPAPAPLPVAPPPAPAPIPAGLGRVAGRVAVSGLAPKLAALPVTRDIKQCGINKPDESLLVGANNGVKDVALWIPSGPQRPEGTAPELKLALAGCQFVPHVAFAAPGARLKLVNQDPVFHSVEGKGAAEFDLPMPVQGYVAPVALKAPGLVKLRCKANPWMSASIQVVATTAATLSAADGTYAINLPPGKHVLRLWHERLGEALENVEVVSGSTTYKDFSMVPNLLPPPRATGERPPDPPDTTPGGR